MISESVKEREGQKERETRRNEKERGEESARVCETKTETVVYICNESFIDVVIVAG